MENKQQQILLEMSALLSAIKTQLDELENKMTECQQMLDNQKDSEGASEAVIEEPVCAEEVAQAPVVEVIPEVVEGVAEGGVEEAEQKVENEVVVEILDAETESPEETVADIFEMEVMDIELEPSDDLPFYDEQPSAEIVEEVINEEVEDDDLPVAEEKPMAQTPVILNEAKEIIGEPVAVIDAMIAKQAWRNDLPGSPVRDIRSAISLNDRILFINYLFDEDPMAFQDMLTKLNAMSSFDEAAACVVAEKPEWDLESDTVYRFMMAVRRRLQ